MLKLLKYEFRKALVSILVLLGITAAMEGYFLYGVFSGEGEPSYHAAIAAMLLVFMTLAVYIFVMIRGVTSYSGELRSRSAYLIFMTPNSTRKIMASKFLFTLALSAFFALVYIGLGYLDIRLLLERLGEYAELIEIIDEAMKELGIHTDQIILAGVFTVIYAALSTLSFFAVAYLAVTLSHTFFRDKSWRWLMAIVFYIALNYLIGFINSLFPAAYSMLNYMDVPGMNNIIAAYNLETTPDFTTLLLYVVPQALVSLATILVSFFGCAYMLEKKISL